MRFRVRAHDGAERELEAADWMGALRAALSSWAVDASATRLSCRATEDGGVYVDDEANRRSWIVRPLTDGAVTAVVSARSAPVAEEPEAVPEVRPLPTGPAPELAMPGGTTLRPPDLDEVDDDEVSEDLAERLFGLSAELSGLEPKAACARAVGVLRQFMDVDAVSMARGLPDDGGLVYIVCDGPVARQVIGKRVPHGEGLVGLAYALAGTVLADDVSSDWRHYEGLDRSTGFQTRQSLCVAILDPEGLAWGVVQVLNPARGRFRATDIDVVEGVARTLSAAFFGVRST